MNVFRYPYVVLTDQYNGDLTFEKSYIGTRNIWFPNFFCIFCPSIAGVESRIAELKNKNKLQRIFLASQNVSPTFKILWHYIFIVILNFIDGQRKQCEWETTNSRCYRIHCQYKIRQIEAAVLAAVGWWQL